MRLPNTPWIKSGVSITPDARARKRGLKQAHVRPELEAIRFHSWNVFTGFRIGPISTMGRGIPSLKMSVLNCRNRIAR